MCIRDRVINNHEVSGFACHRVTDVKKYKTAPTVYSGPNPMSAFYDHIMKESREISKILDVEVPMLALTSEQVKDSTKPLIVPTARNPFQSLRVKLRVKSTIVT